MAKIGNLAPTQRAEEDLEDRHQNREHDPEQVDLAQPRLDGGKIDPAQREVKQPQRHHHPSCKDQKSAHGRSGSLTVRFDPGAVTLRPKVRIRFR
jgi:hypothetical protein